MIVWKMCHVKLFDILMEHQILFSFNNKHFTPSRCVEKTEVSNPFFPWKNKKSHFWLKMTSHVFFVTSCSFLPAQNIPKKTTTRHSCSLSFTRTKAMKIFSILRASCFRIFIQNSNLSKFYFILIDEMQQCGNSLLLWRTTYCSIIMLFVTRIW